MKFLEMIKEGAKKLGNKLLRSPKKTKQPRPPERASADSDELSLTQ